jgi:hypothetical protein
MGAVFTKRAYCPPYEPSRLKVSEQGDALPTVKRPFQALHLRTALARSLLQALSRGHAVQ